MIRRTPQFRERMSHFNCGLLILLAFCLPLSTSIASLIAVLFMLTWLIEGDFKRKFAEMLANPMGLATLIFMAVLLAGLGIGEPKLCVAFFEGLKQWKILLLPLCLTAVRPKQRRAVVWAFIAGMTLMMLVTYLAWLGLVEYDDVNRENLTAGSFHVVYNPMLALALYFLLHQLIWGKLKRQGKLAVGLLTTLMIVNMFMTDGRTGQAVFLLLLPVMLFQYLKTSPWKALLAVILAPTCILLLSYQASPNFRERIEQARHEVVTFKRHPRTSVGQRLFFWEHSWQLFKKHPVLGVGTGNFRAAYAQRNYRWSPHMIATGNPHNQYILIAVQNGLVGLAAFLALFVVQFWLAWKSRDEWGKIRFAFPLFFLVIMFSESYLLIHETGMLFSLMSAVLYKGMEQPESA